MLNNEIQEHPTWAIIDSSKLQTYQSCPRLFFFKYILGWSTERTSHHLVFGESWHRAMEHILIHGYNVKAVTEASNIAEEYYRQHFSAMTDSERGVKIPGNIPVALADYIKNYALDKFEVLHTEISGVVPVSEDRLIHFRMDSILRDPMYQNKITSLEHKTGSRKGVFETYTTNIQSGTYNHVLQSAYEIDEVYGVIFNGVILYKTQEPFFQRVPNRRNGDSMAEWLWTVNHLMDRLEWDMSELDETSDEEQVMPCFHKNTQNCNQYGQCTFYDFCHVWSNPIQYSDEPPFGFKIDRWDPSEREAKAIFDGGVITPVNEYLDKDANLKED